LSHAKSRNLTPGALLLWAESGWRGSQGGCPDLDPLQSEHNRVRSRRLPPLHRRLLRSNPISSSARSRAGRSQRRGRGSAPLRETLFGLWPSTCRVGLPFAWSRETCEKNDDALDGARTHVRGDLLPQRHGRVLSAAAVWIASRATPLRRLASAAPAGSRREQTRSGRAMPRRSSAPDRPPRHAAGPRRPPARRQARASGPRGRRSGAAAEGQQPGAFIAGAAERGGRLAEIHPPRGSSAR
jgi:hypothetical protein